MTQISNELKAAVFDRLVAHFASRTDVQNLDLMNLSGFCRNCLANWLTEAAAVSGMQLDKNAARTEIYGMPYETWKAQYQRVASPEQLAIFKSAMHQE